MSELRERCFDLWEKMPATTKCYCSDIDFNNWPDDVRKACTVCRRVDDIEAFAKEQRLKGMEAVRSRMIHKINAMNERLENCDDDDWIDHDAMIGTCYEALACIDDEIANLKEGGS